MPKFEFLHIMHNDKFNKPFIDFVNANFEPNKHLFLFWGGYKEKILPIPNYPNVIKYAELGLRNKILLRLAHRFRAYYLLKKIHLLHLKLYCYKPKKIYLHGLFNYASLKFLNENSWCLKKCNWQIWGGDLHYKELNLSGIEKDFEKQIQSIVSGISQITSIPGDFDLAKKYFTTKAKFTRGYYINPIKKNFLDEILENGKDKSELNIQIGNSANPTNNHIHVLNLISKFKKENIKVFIPLSYGDKNGYAEYVKKVGIDIFGEKFIPVENYMNPKQYTEFLYSIDIAIFNHDRQQALHNLHALIYLGKKVFLKNNISTWDHLRQFGINVFDIETINQTSYTEFKNFNKEHANRKAVMPLFQSSFLKKIWSLNFSYK